MRLKRINLCNNSYIFVSTPKLLKTYNGKNVVNLCSDNAEYIFNNYNIGDVFYNIKIDYSRCCTQSYINKVYNGEAKLFDKYLIVDKGLVMTKNDGNSWEAYTTFLCMNDDKKLIRLNYYQLSSKDYIQQKLIRYFKNSKAYFERELSLLDKDKDKRKYRNRVKVIQQCSELIEKLPRLFV